VKNSLRSSYHFDFIIVHKSALKCRMGTAHQIISIKNFLLHFHAWLYAITANLCKNFIRSRSRRLDQDFIEDQDPDILETPSIDAYRDELIDDFVHEALKSLPETYQQVITLHYLGGMTSREIAEFIGTSPTAVRERLSRARALLKEDVLAMMNKNFETQRLHTSFTFHIIESVKKIKISPIPKAMGLPWGLSLATGIIATIMSIGLHLNVFDQSLLQDSSLSAESTVVKDSAIPVKVAKISQYPLFGRENGENNLQNSFFMAPQAEGGTWERKANMPTPRLDLRTCVVDGIIYAIGGWTTSPVSTVEAYDTKTDTWTKKADMPTARRGLSTCEVDGMIYAIGGLIGRMDARVRIPTVEAYDPKTDTWTKKADMPTPRAGLTTSVVDGIIYAIAGWWNSSVSAVEAYDPKTDTWTKKADIPIPKWGHSACVVDGAVYVFGGFMNDDIPDFTMQTYNPKSDIWVKKGEYPRFGILNFSGCAIDDTIYALTASNDNRSITFVAYDPAMNRWMELKTAMPTFRGWVPTSVVDGKIYTIGGGNAWDVALDDGVVEEYTPEASPFAVSPNDKLPTKWGKAKTAFGR
jgi:RNA polymerase sigma factor (sigma-70 family)